MEEAEPLDDSGEPNTDLDGAEEGDLDVDQPAGKVSLEKADRSLAEFHRWQKNGRLVLDSEWQRNRVWSVPNMSKLVESFLIDLPVPVP